MNNNEAVKRYRAKNSEKVKKASRIYGKRYYQKNRAIRLKLAATINARNRYGLSYEQWIKLRQHPCQICGRNNKERVIDHDHKKKKSYRGVLCKECNIKLGWHEKWINTINSYLKGAFYVNVQA